MRICSKKQIHVLQIQKDIPTYTYTERLFDVRMDGQQEGNLDEQIRISREEHI